MGQSCPEPEDYFDDKYMKLAHPAITNVDCTAEGGPTNGPSNPPVAGGPTDIVDEIFGPSKPACSNYQNQGTSELKISYMCVQRSKKWLVRGLVKFTTAVARLVCLDLLG